MDDFIMFKGRKIKLPKIVYLYRKYKESPTEENKEELRIAYEKIPEDEKKFCLGDQDNKDISIRIILYGEEEIKNSIQYVVAGILEKMNIKDIKDADGNIIIKDVKLPTRKDILNYNKN